MSEGIMYDAIVVGAGIIGSATAYYLSKSTSKVLLLEQFDFLHRRGSSHGETRIIRKTYVQEPYTFLMKDAYKQWEKAEQEYGSKVFTKTGGIDIIRPDADSYQAILSSAIKYNVPIEVMTPDHLTQKYSTIKLPAGHVALYSPDAGTLNATKAVAMFQSLALLHGCELRDNTPVISIDEDERFVIVSTKPGLKLMAKKVIVTAGPWTKKLFKTHNLPLRLLQTTVSYWKVNDPSVYSHERFPVFISYGNPLIYGCPAREYPNMIKCGAHFASDCDPDTRDFNMSNGGINSVISKFLQTSLEGVELTPTITESCIYTESPDMGFIMDYLPSSRNVLIGCGFSGHGFKLAPVVGTILSQLVVGNKHPYPDLEKYFKLERFKS